MAGVKRRIFTDSDIHALHKELDEVSCPICMDHPHNAVLLLCSSHEQGCRSYICDTSYRHSNCLDRFKKLRSNSRNSPALSQSVRINSQNYDSTSNGNLALRTDLIEGNESYDLNQTNSIASVLLPEGNIQDPNRHLDSDGEGILEIGSTESPREEVVLEELHSGSSLESKSSLKCPLCRGDVLGWEVVEEARKYLNLKKRSCSRESCSFSGNYLELRRHARRVHPTTRPSDVDPSRERAWHRLEHQREYGDIVSAIQSAMPGAVVVGDYVIENGHRISADRESGAGEVGAPWWTTFFLFQMIGTIDSVGEPRARSRAWSRHQRPAGALSERRFLWGENLLGLQDDDDNEHDVHIFSDVGEDASPIPRRRHRIFTDVAEDASPIPRRRRRVIRSRSDEDQS